jgi:hypothetical protein
MTLSFYGKHFGFHDGEYTQVLVTLSCTLREDSISVRETFSAQELHMVRADKIQNFGALDFVWIEQVYTDRTLSSLTANICVIQIKCSMDIFW